ncbi:MAG TPA: T9SS type A sorting domain-containing protein [Ignavibacteriaceae bacterium]|nr:T9SS type A sorting domain-containing protein [Ignavibacteriaceae bacterium]
MINNPDLFGKGLINCVGSLTSLHIANQPKNLILTNYNSHPKLTWDTNIPTLANNINDFSKYRILRSLENQYNYVNVGEVVYDHTLQTHTWTDNSIIIRKGPLKVYYRVVLVMSDDEESITSNEVSAPIGYPSKKFSTSKIDYSLTQNYPNPFNPTTTISYSLPLSGFTTLKIYDILTNEVATLVNEDKLAGSYVVEFNASNLSSGVYFYNLTSGSYSINKKMILMK